MTKYRPPSLRGAKNLSQKRVVGIPVTPVNANVALLALGLILGVAAFHYKDAPVGNVLLAAAGSMVGVSTVFVVNESLFGSSSPA
jgi:hypothetical protein